MPSITIEAVAGHGNGIKAGGVWYSRSRDAEFPTFKDVVKRGDVLEIEGNGTWVTKFTKTGTGAPAPGGASGAKPPFRGRVMTDDERKQIARAAATKSSLESPVLAELVKNMDLSQAISETKGVIKQMTAYILTGDFNAEA